MARTMTWKPHVTVAAIIEDRGRFLMVREQDNGKPVINQPAGHLEDGENLVDAVVRETLEETAWSFQPTAISGIYRWRQPLSKRTFLRVCFCGEKYAYDPDAGLDPDIETTLWLDRGELGSGEHVLRSPMVLRCIDDYLAGHRWPLEILQDVD